MSTPWSALVLGSKEMSRVCPASSCIKASMRRVAVTWPPLARSSGVRTSRSDPDVGQLAVAMAVTAFTNACMWPIGVNVCGVTRMQPPLARSLRTTVKMP